MFINADWSMIATLICNMILNTTPEKIFLVMFSLALLKQFDFLRSIHEGENRFKLYDLQMASLPVFISSVIANYMKYMGVDATLEFFISYFILYISIIGLYEMYSGLDEIVKAFLAVSAGHIILVLIEFMYISLALAASGIARGSFKGDLLLNCILTFPARILEYSIVLYLLAKKAAFMNASIVRNVLKNAWLRTITIVFVLANGVIFMIAYRLIAIDKVLAQLTVNTQISISAAVLSYLTLNCIILFFTFFYFLNHDYYKRYRAKEELQITVDDIKMFAERKIYDKMINEIEQLEEDMERLV